MKAIHPCGASRFLCFQVFKKYKLDPRHGETLSNERYRLSIGRWRSFLILDW